MKLTKNELINLLIKTDLRFSELMDEIDHEPQFKCIGDFPHAVNKSGEVYSTMSGWIKPQTDRNGYQTISLGYKGKKKSYTVNRAVLLAHCPIKGNPTASGFDSDHIDCDRSHNNLSNLRWLPSQINRSSVRMAQLGK